MTALEDLLVRHVETGTIPGAVALLGRGDDAEVAAIGAASGDGRPMWADAIMQIQSMTKVITSVAALRLVEAGRLGLDESVKGPLRGRYGSSSGQGTDFFVDRDGTVGILLTQVELGERTWPLLGEFQALHQPT
jgi:CubicO group peptidase (beta-lactamase class C family)